MEGPFGQKTLKSLLETDKGAAGASAEFSEAMLSELILFHQERGSCAGSGVRLRKRGGGRDSLV